MDDRPPDLSPAGAEPPPAGPDRRRYRRHRPSHALPIALGILLGAAAIAFYVWHRVNGIRKNRAILAQPDPVDPRRP